MISFLKNIFKKKPKNGFYITKWGNKRDVKCFMSNFVYITHKNITELSLVDNGNIESLWCFDNYITSVQIPKSVHSFRCQRNSISSLHIPPSVFDLKCDLMDGIEEQNHGRIMMEIFQKR